jgi:hypothetical protein
LLIDLDKLLVSEFIDLNIESTGFVRPSYRRRWQTIVGQGINENLRCLNLARNKIGDTGVVALAMVLSRYTLTAHESELHDHLMYETSAQKISDEVELLPGNSPLATLILDDTLITSFGFSNLTSVLKVNPKIVNFSIEGNRDLRPVEIHSSVGTQLPPRSPSLPI